MKRSLREILAESHIAPVAIAVMLLWTLTSAASAVGIPFYEVAEYAVTAVAILGIPYSSHSWNFADWFMFLSTVFGLYGALVSLAGAWFLSRWVYGFGPFRALIECRSRLVGRTDA